MPARNSKPAIKAKPQPVKENSDSEDEDEDEIRSTSEVDSEEDIDEFELDKEEDDEDDDVRVLYNYSKKENAIIPRMHTPYQDEDEVLFERPSDLDDIADEEEDAGVHNIENMADSIQKQSATRDGTLKISSCCCYVFYCFLCRFRG